MSTALLLTTPPKTFFRDEDRSSLPSSLVMATPHLAIEIRGVSERAVPSIPVGTQRLILSVLAPSYVEEGKSWKESSKTRVMNQSWLC